MGEAMGGRRRPAPRPCPGFPRSRERRWGGGGGGRGGGVGGGEDGEAVLSSSSSLNNSNNKQTGEQWETSLQILLWYEIY